ncbi:hypothetical protein ACJX0J_016338, partial [Zea mays]
SESIFIKNKLHTKTHDYLYYIVLQQIHMNNKTNTIIVLILLIYLYMNIVILSKRLVPGLSTSKLFNNFYIVFLIFTMDLNNKLWLFLKFIQYMHICCLYSLQIGDVYFDDESAESRVLENMWGFVFLPIFFVFAPVVNILRTCSIIIFEAKTQNLS